MIKISKSLIILLFTISLIIIACGEKSNEEAEQEVQIEVVVQQPIKESIIYAAGIDNSENISTLIDMFNEQSQKTNVKYQSLPYDKSEQYNQILLRLSAGDWEADVFNLDANWCAELASKGYLQELDGYTDNLSRYISSSIDNCMFNHKLWAMPQTVSFPVLYYRKDIISKLPASKEEFIESINNSLNEGRTLYGYIFPGKHNESMLQMLFQAINHYGGHIIGEDGGLDIFSEQNIEALNYLYDLCNNDYVPENVYGMTEVDTAISFLWGESPFMNNSYRLWEMCSNEESLIKNKFDIMPVYSSVIISTSANAINGSSDKAEQGWEFIDFISSYEGQKKLALDGDVPALKAVISDSEVIERNPFFFSEGFEDTLSNSSANISTPHFKEISDIVIEELYLFLNGEKDAEQALRDMQSRA